MSNIQINPQDVIDYLSGITDNKQPPVTNKVMTITNYMYASIYYNLVYLPKEMIKIISEYLPCNFNMTYFIFSSNDRTNITTTFTEISFVDVTISLNISYKLLYVEPPIFSHRYYGPKNILKKRLHNEVMKEEELVIGYDMEHEVTLILNEIHKITQDYIF